MTPKRGARVEFAELEGEDAYEILRVARDASPAEIRRAHRELIKEHHPDLVQDVRAKARAESRTRLLNAARDVLISNRETYDAFLRPPEAEPEPAPSDDPWAAARPGRPGPEDPWKDAESGPAPPPPPPTPPPPPPQRPRRPPPGPPPYRPHRRGPTPGLKLIRKRKRRRRMTGAAGVFIALLIPTALVMSGIIESSEDSSGPQADAPDHSPGSWAGEVTKDSGGKWNVEFTLPPLNDDGVAVYTTGACRGGDKVLSREPGQVKFSSQFPSDEPSGPECVNGHVELRGNIEGGGDVAAAIFSEEGESVAQGILQPKDP